MMEYQAAPATVQTETTQRPDPLETARRALGEDFAILMDTSRPIDVSAIRVHVDKVDK